jgi:cell wall-associated NlpC family hydrolase
MSAFAKLRRFSEDGPRIPMAERILRSDEQQARVDIVREAREWLNTPYHPHARLKGVGVDCLTLVVEVLERVGVIEHQEIGHYSPEGHLHQSEDLWKPVVELYAREMELPPARLPKPGDLVLYRVAKAFNHNAIVIEWPVVIHAHIDHGVLLADAERDPQLRFGCRERAVFSLW